jgi:hypothetical protein
MHELKIHFQVCRRGCLMIVFRTKGKCWQFRIVLPDGCSISTGKVYYTPEGAEDAAKLWLRT